MSYLIGAGSTKVDRAIRFGRELERAMAKRAVGRRVVARAIGSSDTSVMYWRTGRMLPRIETADRLAEALQWPRISSLARELRRKSCLVCEVAFVDDSGSDNRTYCSPGCQRVKEKGRVGADRRQRAAVAERRLVVVQRAVEAYCLACEPDGRCRTDDCQLRPASPLPLETRPMDVIPVRPSPRNGYRAPGQQAATTSRVWARYTPEERAARIERAAEARHGARRVPA